MQEALPEGGNRVRGKVAIVTGAGSSAEGIGNGRGAAIMLAQHGARVCLVDFDEASATETSRMITEAGGESFVAQADVTDEAACQATVKKTVERWGRLDAFLGALELVFEIEERFKVKVPDERIPEFRTVRAVCDGIEALQGA